MNRRSAIGLGAAATLAAGFAGGAAASEAAEARAGGTTMPDTSSPQRAYAAEALTGLLNLTLPSFRADMKTLDEAGLRTDIRAAKAQGFSGTLPLIDWTPAGANWELYHRTLIDEAGPDFPVHGLLYGSDVATDIALTRKLETLGVKMLLLASRYPEDATEDELYDLMRARIEATDLPVMLYAALGKGRSFAHLGPAGQPLGVYDRIADLPNVVAVKVSQPVTLTSTRQLLETVGDRLLVGPVNLDYVPLLARHHHIQWSGQWNGEAVQTPSRQLGNQLLHACAAKDFETADRIAREMQPVHDLFYRVQSDVIRAGSHPWQHNRYWSWLGGGNGGLLPESGRGGHATPTLTAEDRAAMRAAFADAGLEPTDAPEEQFLVGRANWDRGVRASDLPDASGYAA